MCVCVGVRACVRACVRARVCVCVCVCCWIGLSLHRQTVKESTSDQTEIARVHACTVRDSLTLWVSQLDCITGYSSGELENRSFPLESL